MKGAIIGDVVGSVHEHAGTKTTAFPWLVPQSGFTDDTVLTVAVAECLLDDEEPADALRRWGRRYPHAGYGGLFFRWLLDPSAGAYGSWGNGGPMRVSPCGHLAQSMEQAMAMAERVTAVTHNHPDAVHAAQAVATAIWLARQSADASHVRREIEDRFKYDLSVPLDNIRPAYRFDVSSAGTVPPALIAAFEADDLEGAVRNAVSLGGDADTLACIAGSVAEPLYGLSAQLWQPVHDRLPADVCAVIDRFEAQTG